MDWNEFNRELQKRVSDPGIRYCLGIVYERLIEVAKQVDACTAIQLESVKMLSNFVSLNEAMDHQVKTLNKIVKGNSDGVSVESVPITNDDA
jgi:hypothetical protein